MRTRVFAPLGLLCSFNVLDLPDIDEVAVLYRNQGGWTPMADHYLGVPPPAPDLSGYVPGTNGLFFAPQGGLRASAHDLVRLLAVLDGGGGLRRRFGRLRGRTATTTTACFAAGAAACTARTRGPRTPSCPEPGRSSAIPAKRPDSSATPTSSRKPGGGLRS